VTIHGLRHPNIVRAIDLDPYGDPPYLVMEFVSGDSLRSFINAHPGGMPVPAVKAVMEGLLSALAIAHEAGVIHRDIKPANILLTQRADQAEQVTPQSVKVTDFGLGRAGGVTMHSIMQSAERFDRPDAGFSGTVAYMSPEQMEGSECDGRSDLYACGIVLFEMLCGERPQGAETPMTVRPDVPRALDEAFKRCYARRERRFATANEMLAAISATGPSEAPPVAGQRKCPSCHGVVRVDDNYCIHCGWQLVESVPRCYSCGGFVDAADRFCIFCGADLRRAQAG
jgi:serine/threonine-protein kinase